MPVDFFKESCKSTSRKKEFGLCDDPLPVTKRAYIDEDDPIKWIGIVNNTMKKQGDIYAIDHCIDIFKLDGNMESRCDGMLHHDNKLIFVELKARKKKGSQLQKFKDETGIILKAQQNITI